jgi:hypothetical protein
VVWCTFTFCRFDDTFFICPVFENQLHLFPYYWIMDDNYAWKKYEVKFQPSLFWGIMLLGGTLLSYLHHVTSQKNKGLNYTVVDTINLMKIHGLISYRGYSHGHSVRNIIQ